MKRLLSCIFLGLAVTVALNAHFVFVTPEQGGASARIFISENLLPDLDAGMISGTKLNLLDGQGADSPLTLERGDKNYFSVALAGSGTRVVYGVTDLGVMSRGGKSHVLIYYPKAVAGNAFDPKAQVGEKTPVELVALGKPGDLKLKLLAKGKALADSEVTVILPDGNEKKVKTDANGETPAFTAAGRYGAWARYWEPTPGERDGKKYEEVRRYATLVIDAGEATSATASAAPSSAEAAGFTKLPQPTASFGAVVADGWLYVYGGHISPTHTYFKEAVSGRFDRVNLKGQPVWEPLAEGPRMQGMNLAAYKGKIYRVGGMQPQNEKNKAADNRSLAEAARFDSKSGKWEELPPMPETRSSHDVVVIGDKLIVVGGWSMEGPGHNTWRDTLAILDLSSKKLAWTSAPQPFKRRALMAATLNGKMYVIGGMDDKNQVQRKVSIYDPKSNQWTEGPELPEGAQLGFAPAAGVHQGQIFVSLADGSLMRLDTKESAWIKAGSTTPRVAHRMASDGRSILLIGGAAKGKNLDLVEAVPIDTKQMTAAK